MSKNKRMMLRYDQLMDDQDKLADWRCGAEYRYSNTGVAVAEGYDMVVLIEDVEIREDGGISLQALPKNKGENIRPVGSSMAKGELLFPAYRQNHGNQRAGIESQGGGVGWQSYALSGDTR